MAKSFKRLISALLVIAMLLTSVGPVFAEDISTNGVTWHEDDGTLYLQYKGTSISNSNLSAALIAKFNSVSSATYYGVGTSSNSVSSVKKYSLGVSGNTTFVDNTEYKVYSATQYKNSKYDWSEITETAFTFQDTREEVTFKSGSIEVNYYDGIDKNSTVPQNIRKAVLETAESNDFQYKNVTVQYYNGKEYTNITASSTSSGRHKFGQSTETVKLSFSGNNNYKPFEVNGISITLTDLRSEIAFNDDPTVNFYEGIQTSTARQNVKDAVLKTENSDTFDYDNVTVQYFNGNNYANIGSNVSAGQHKFGESGDSKEKVKLSFSGNNTYKSFTKDEIEISLSDLRAVTDIQYESVGVKLGDDYSAEILKQIKLVNTTAEPDSDITGEIINVEVPEILVTTTSATVTASYAGNNAYKPVQESIVVSVNNDVPYYTLTTAKEGSGDFGIYINNKKDTRNIITYAGTDNPSSFTVKANPSYGYFVDSIIVGKDIEGIYVAQKNSNQLDTSLTMDTSDLEDKADYLVSVKFTEAELILNEEPRIESGLSGEDLEQAVFDAIVNTSATKPNISLDDVKLEYKSGGTDLSWHNLGEGAKLPSEHNFGEHTNWDGDYTEEIRITSKNKYGNKTLQETVTLIIGTRTDVDWVQNESAELSYYQYFDVAKQTKLEAVTQAELDKAVLSAIFENVSESSPNIIDAYDNGKLAVEYYAGSTDFNLSLYWSDLDWEQSRIRDITRHTFGQNGVDSTEKIRITYKGTKDYKPETWNVELKFGDDRIPTSIEYEYPDHSILLGLGLSLVGVRDDFDVIYYDVDAASEGLKSHVLDNVILVGDDYEPGDTWKEEAKYTIDKEHLNVNLLQPQDVTITYLGDQYHKNCSKTIKVYVLQHESDIDVAKGSSTYRLDEKGKAVAYDVASLVSATPEALDKLTTVIGIDGDASGFVSMYFPQSVIDSLQITRGEIRDANSSGRIDWSFFEDLMDRVIGTDDSDIIFDGYKLLADFINDHDLSNFTSNIAELAEDFTEYSKFLPFDTDSLTKLAEEIAKLDLPATSLKAKIKLNEGPKDAGIYWVSAISTDINYQLAFDSNWLTILPAQAELKWANDVPLTGELSYEQANINDPKFDFDVKLDKKNGNDPVTDSHTHTVFIKAPLDEETLVKYLESIPRVIQENAASLMKINDLSSSITALQKILNNNLLPVELVTGDSYRQPGTYIEIAYTFGGNYWATPKLRTYKVNYLELDAILKIDGNAAEVKDGVCTLTYDGKEHTVSVEAGLKHEKPLEAKFTKNCFDMFLNVLPIPSDNKIKDAGTYELLVTCLGDSVYKDVVKTYTIKVEPKKAIIDFAFPINNILSWSTAQNFNFGYTVKDLEDADITNSLKVRSIFGGAVNELFPDVDNEPIRESGVYLQIGFELDKNYEADPIYRLYAVADKNVTIESDGNVAFKYDGTRKGITPIVTSEDGKDISKSALVYILYTGTDTFGNAYNSVLPPINVGDYTATVMYNGVLDIFRNSSVKTIDFTIIPTSLESFAITGLNNNYYNGEIQKAEFTVKSADEKTVLVEGRDYTVSYALKKTPGESVDPKEIGEYIVTVTGINNYEGAITSTYVISRRPSSSARTYKVDLPDAVANGTIKADKTSASKNSTVTLTVSPAEDFRLGSLTVVDKNGALVELTNLGDGKYSFKMPACDVTVKVSFVNGCDRGEGCSLRAFLDLNPLAWYHDGIEYCLDEKIMSGLSNGLFAPQQSLTRSMLVSILWRMAGKPVVNYAMNFSDVNGLEWYAEAVRWAASEKIVSGYTDGRFGPKDNITREQLAAILYRFGESQKVDFSKYTKDTNTLSFEDIFTVRNFAKTAMNACIASGIISGSKGYVKPQGLATRAEAATMMYHFCGVLEEK